MSEIEEVGILEKTEFVILNEIISVDEINKIDHGVREKLESYFKNKFDEFITFKAVFETRRKNYEEQLDTLKNNTESDKALLSSYQERLETLKKVVDDMQYQIDANKKESLNLEETIKRLEKEREKLDQERSVLSDENNMLYIQIERKDLELDRLRKELTSLSSQLQSAISAKCQALSSLEDLSSKEMSLDYREKRLNQEKLLFSQQITNLEEQLLRRTDELQLIRSETSARMLLLQTRVFQSEEELKLSNDSLVKLREGCSSLQQRCDSLNQKLEEQRNNELLLHASYQEEINAQIKLAGIYKKMSEETHAKSDEYCKAVKELQSLLEQATHQYGILETKFNKLVTDHKAELNEKEGKINDLEKTLSNLNDLMESLKKDNLDKTVEKLAPTAAVASKILKKGLSLTQIYSKLVETTNDSLAVKEENIKLKSQMEIILKELEERAPIIRQQQENYENALSSINSLSARVECLVTENNRLQETVNETNRLSNHHIAENHKLKTEMTDLARQVCFLLQEVQETRTASNIDSNNCDSDSCNNLMTSRIISKKLVTFKDIEELQENNQKLLSLVRTLSARQEKTEISVDHVDYEEMKEKISRYVQQLADMQEAQNRQSNMLEEILKQRDMYKNLYNKNVHPSFATTNIESEGMQCEENNINKKPEDETVEKEEKNMIDIYEKKNDEMKAKYSNLLNNFELYKKEKISHEKMLNEEIERLRQESEKYSIRCCRLKAQLESINERFNFLQSNATSYKSQIKILEDKCNNYICTIGKHEQSLMLLKDEVLSSQNRLSKAEVQLLNITQEKQLLQDSENRLLKEREVLHRERHTNALLKADVESIKASLERVQAETQLRTEQRLDDTIRECAALRRRLQEEQDRFRQFSTSLEQKNENIQKLLDEEKLVTKQIQSKLDNLRLQEQNYIKRIDILNEKLKNLSTNVTLKPVEDELMKKQIHDLEMKLASSQCEVKSLVDQLKAARFQSQQYCDIAESAEIQLRENTEMYNQKKKELDDNLIRLKQELDDANKKLRHFEKGNMPSSTDYNISEITLQERLAIAERELRLMDDLRNELKQTKNDLHVASASVLETENKYAREMDLHAADLKMLSKFKEENHILSTKIMKLMQQEDLAKEALLVEKKMWQDREKQFFSEKQELQKRLDDLDAQNVLLHNQIQEFSEQSAIIQSQLQTDLSAKYNVNLENNKIEHKNCDNDAKSIEQLLQVIKFLRREKDLFIAKYDVLKSENARLKSQSELSIKRLKESKETLDSLREKNEINIVAASKHSELLRKIETLNAITDSNRILREEKDSLSIKIKDLTVRINSLLADVVPIKEKNRQLEESIEIVKQENLSLKSEATRWRQRANVLVERTNRASPEDWRRLQSERENLSKLLSQEREVYSKQTEELCKLKNEKINLEEQVNKMHKQFACQEEQILNFNKEMEKLKSNNVDLIALRTEKEKDIDILKTELSEKNCMLAEAKNKEIQIRKIAKKYKMQYEELSKHSEDTRLKNNDNQNIQIGSNKSNADDNIQLLASESMNKDIQTHSKAKIEELNKQISSLYEETENLKKEIGIVNKTSIEKEERAKQVLKGARTKIMQLTEYKRLCEKEMHELKEKLDSSTIECESSISEYEAKITAIKSQMESRIIRLEHERSDLQAEKEVLLQRAVLLQRQLSGQNTLSVGVIEPPTANIKPMSARTETPLASIRPMSVVVQSRTAAVFPTTVGPTIHISAPQSQQQLVHTTETSSPTSSLMDYQPASTSRQHILQSHVTDSAESTQREESDVFESLSNLQPQMTSQQQNQMQTVALISPRIEQQQPFLPSDQPQTAPSSSTQSVSTSLTNLNHKRPRTFEPLVSGPNVNENQEHKRQEQVLSPKTKKCKVEESNTAAVASNTEIEYQVPTSSQRDQEDEADDQCTTGECDEDIQTCQVQEDDFDNIGYEDLEDDEIQYSVEVEGVNNEVEIVIEDESINVEVPRISQPDISREETQQSEAISSAGLSRESPSFTARLSRGIGHVQRQQSHLILQGYDDAGDDSIVPSTPTLLASARNDSYGETINSPQIHTRFSFSEASTPTTVTSVQSQTSSLLDNTRSMYTSCPGSELAQVLQEGMDDTKIDLTQLDKDVTERDVPDTPKDTYHSTESNVINEGSEEQNIPIPSSRVMQADIDEYLIHASSSSTTSSFEENSMKHEKEVTETRLTVNKNVPNTDLIENVHIDENRQSPTRGTVDSETACNSDVSNQHTLKDEDSEAEASSASSQISIATSGNISENITPTGRGATARRSIRTSFRTSRGQRPTPIVWDSQTTARGQTQRGSSRGAVGDGTRVRSIRGRRMRSKFPYNY